MKPANRLLLLLLPFIMCFSACLHREEAAPPKNPNTPKALQDDKGSSFSLISKSRGVVMIQEIYNGLLEERPDLAKLEADIETYNSLQNDSLSKYGKYSAKSMLYYRDANACISTITDSVLKHEMQQVIATSQARFNLKISAINKMIADLGKKDTTLANYHTVMKLLITLPVIEQFQKDELPDDKILHQLTKDKQRLIDRTQKLTPKLK